MSETMKCSTLDATVGTARDSIIRRLPTGITLAILAAALVGMDQISKAGGPSTDRPVRTITSRNDPTAHTQEAGQLEPGKPMERELAGNQAHSYRVRLEAEQFLRLVVEQRGIDVAVMLVGPDGTQILEINTENGTKGLEQILFVAEARGNYRLGVRSLEKGAAAGRYEIKIEDLRKATPHDREKVATQKLFLEGVKLQSQGTAESLRGAAEKYQAALKGWGAVDEPRAKAETLSNLGEVYYYLGETKRALESWLQELPLREAIEDRRGIAETLSNIGVIYDFLGDRQKALDHYNRGLQMIRAVGDRSLEATALNNIGVVYKSLGDNRKALEYYDQALPIRRNVGDRSGEAGTLNNIGLVYESLGDYRKALEYYDQALPITRDVGDRRLEAITLNSTGAVYESLGNYRKALEYYDQALPIRRNVGDRNGEANTLNNIGVVYELLRDNRKALEYCDQSLKIKRDTGDRRGEAIALNNIGAIHKSLGDNRKALEYYDQALKIRRDTGDRGGEVATLANMARAEHNLGNLTEARNHIESSLSIVESLRNNIAGQDLRSSYFTSVRKHFQVYIDLLMRLHQLHPKGGHDRAALEASERGRARSLLEILAEARADFRQGVDPDLLERERSLLQLLDAKSERLVRLLSRKHTQNEKETLAKELESLSLKYQEVQALIRAKSPRYAALTQPVPLSLEEIQKQVLDQNTLLLEYSLGDERSYLWAVTNDSMMSFELPKREVIEKAAQRVYDLLATHQRSRRGPAEQQQKARLIEASDDYLQAATELSRMLLNPVTTSLQKKRVVIVADGALNYVPFAALPSPGAGGWGSGAGEKTTNPPTPNPQSPTSSSDPKLMIEEHEIVSLPSASALAVLRRELQGRKPAPKLVAVLADPVFDRDDARVRIATTAKKKPSNLVGGQQAEPTASSDAFVQRFLSRSAGEVGITDADSLPRLPFSRREAEAIYSVAQQKGALKALDFDASRETASSAEMSQYRIIHFATHGLLNNEHPDLSGLVLSLVDRGGKPRNGFFRLYEIYNLDLGAELVVLSACQTGLGKPVNGEGLVGMTRGFMYAGAARVAASLWRVDDEATSELVKKFYESMLKEGQTPAAALRSAQIWMKGQKRWRLPYYWAGFVLQGEWR